MFGNLFSKKPTPQTHIPPKRRDAFDTHLDLTWKIEAAYKKRDSDPKAIEKTIELCKMQIALAPEAKIAWTKEDNSLGIQDSVLPMHKGYEQLCVLYEKQSDFDSAIALAREAKQEGWAGEWDKRIERSQKKLLKVNKTQ